MTASSTCLASTVMSKTCDLAFMVTNDQLCNGQDVTINIILNLLDLSYTSSASGTSALALLKNELAELFTLALA